MATSMTSRTESGRSCRNRTGNGGDDGSGGKTLRVNPNWPSLPLFDRKGWKRLTFGAFADSVNERVEPADAQEEIYVGLEHLDSGSLHIRRWGKGCDVIGTKLRFRKGDIIFGRSNGPSLAVIIEEGNRTLRGWFEYFKHSNKWTFPPIDSWVRRRIRSILRKRTGLKGISRGHDHQRWPNLFFREHGFFSLVDAHATLLQSSQR